MRLPVGSVVFVSHRLQRVVFRVCKVSGKKYLATNVAGKFFSLNGVGLTFLSRYQQLNTFAFLIYKHDCPGWGTA